MSKHSFVYNLNQRKYSLKFIIYLFILFDILLFYYVSFSVLFVVITWELSVFIGLLIGLRGQARYRELVWELIAIRRDPKFNNKEELRGHRLARHIDHACVEYDIWFEESKPKRNKKKKRKNSEEVIKRMNDKILEVIKKIDDRILESIGLWLVGILAIFTVVLGEWLYLIEISGFWILFILAVWDLTDALLLIIIIFYFKLKKEDNEPIPIGKVAVVNDKIQEIETKSE